MPAATPKSIVVTGANKGIGYEAVKRLAQGLPNSIIYLTARSQSNGKDAVEKMKKEVPAADFSNVRILLLEVLDSSSIQEAVATVQKECGTLDVLLHNSGILQVPGEQGSKGVFDVNVRGAKAVIDAFAKILTKETGKVIVVSSEVGTWATAAMDPSVQKKVLDSSTTNWDQMQAWMDDWLRHEQGSQQVQEPWKPVDHLVNSGYALSKAFLNAYLRNYALQSESPQLAVVCPGYCATEFNGFSGPRSASLGGESVIWPAFNDFKTGHFYQDGKDLPFSQSMPENLNL
ncbi:related to carbonyl reductase [Ustilago bromivora]|uniref:Related to carbonyl reductase n=1 Tax=Ustilago bromivora TaxID=307758 RepID=A0A1K0HK66_9BASI|nr:related to carbonyl reductase [Ustilago bromivora]SYW82903.1 related to carbonyl reductase [Ustilago bromivora]